MRLSASADVLPKWHEELVDLNPMFARQFTFQFGHGLFRRRGIHITPPIGHAMHMDIHPDSTLAARNP